MHHVFCIVLGAFHPLRYPYILHEHPGNCIVSMKYLIVDTIQTIHNTHTCADPVQHNAPKQLLFSHVETRDCNIEIL